MEIGINPVTHQVYVTNNGGTGVTVLNGNSAGSTFDASVNTTISLASAPVAVAVNPTLSRVLVTQANGNLAIINGATNTKITDAAFC